MLRPLIGVPVLLDLLVPFLVALVLDLQLLARLVQHVLQPLVDRWLAYLASGLVAKLRIAVTVELVLTSPLGILKQYFRSLDEEADDQALLYLQRVQCSNCV